LLQAGASKDRAASVTYSKQLGFLTGLESPKMIDAHVNSLQTLAFPLSYSKEDRYDFSKSSGITSTVKQDIPVMLRERLTPPPDETYALHRKLSGFFLLCYRLKSRVACQQIFQQIVQKTS
jgi:aarF domain-containing kinase